MPAETVTLVTGAGSEPGRWPYAAAKAAAVNLVRSGAIDFASAGIRVNVREPGQSCAQRRDAETLFGAGHTDLGMGGDVPASSSATPSPARGALARPTLSTLVSTA